MRQAAPWGRPVTNPGAFGAGADDETFGSRLRMPGLTPDQVRLGHLGDPPDAAVERDTAGTDAGTDLGTDDESGHSSGGGAAAAWMQIGKAAAMVALGGALVGYLASGGRGWRGAAIGATTNLTLFYGGTVIAGRSVQPTSTTAILGALTVASGAGAAYLFMQQRRRK